MTAQPIRPLYLMIKSLLLFLILNLSFILLNPQIGRLSAYNVLFPGRLRFPIGRNPQSYNITTDDIDAMFNSHVISANKKTTGEYRVIILGDSSTWGARLAVNQTLSEQLNARHMTVCGREVRVYNLAYPLPSVSKDILILSTAMKYQPDRVIWQVSLSSFLRWNQAPPLATENAVQMMALLDSYDISYRRASYLPLPTIWDKTILGQRQNLGVWSRLQLYGVLWGATGIDVYFSRRSEFTGIDLPASLEFKKFKPPLLDTTRLSLDVLDAGAKIAGGIPILVVNEPIQVLPGKNSDIRYNWLYPRWAFDQYRHILSDMSPRGGWEFLDLYDAVPFSEFTDTVLHLNPSGTNMLAERLASEIKKSECTQY